MWRGYSVEGYYDTCWQTGHWSTQAKVEGTVLKVAWQLGSDSSVISNPLGEPGRASLYVGPPSPWGSVCLNIQGTFLYISHSCLKLTVCFLFLAIAVTKHCWYCSQKFHSYAPSFLHMVSSHNYTKLNMCI